MLEVVWFYGAPFQSIFKQLKYVIHQLHFCAIFFNFLFLYFILLLYFLHLFQRQVQVDELHCFGSPTARLAHQRVILYHVTRSCKGHTHNYMCLAHVFFLIIVLFILPAIYILFHFFPFFFFISSRIFYSHSHNYATSNHMAMILCHFVCQSHGGTTVHYMSCGRGCFAGLKSFETWLYKKCYSSAEFNVSLSPSFAFVSFTLVKFTVNNVITATCFFVR